MAICMQEASFLDKVLSIRCIIMASACSGCFTTVDVLCKYSVLFVIALFDCRILSICIASHSRSSFSCTASFSMLSQSILSVHREATSKGNIELARDDQRGRIRREEKPNRSRAQKLASSLKSGMWPAFQQAGCQTTCFL